MTTSNAVPSVRNAERLPEVGDIITVWYPYDQRLPKHAAIVATEPNDTGAFDITVFAMSGIKEGGTLRAIEYVGNRGRSWEFKA